MKLNVFNMDISKFESYTRINCNYIQLIGIQFFLTIVRLNKRGKKSGCIWQPAQLYRVRIMMPMLSIAFLHWFATFQTQTSSTVKSDSIFQGLVYSNFLPPLFNPSSSLGTHKGRDLGGIFIHSPSPPHANRSCKIGTGD